MEGPGGVIVVMLMRKFGRLPVLFWSQVSQPVIIRDVLYSFSCELAPCSWVSRWRCLVTYSQDIRWYVEHSFIQMNHMALISISHSFKLFDV